MIVDKIAAKKTLAVTLALALGLVIPTGAFAQVDARIAPVSASVGAPAAASVVGLQTISLTIPTVAPSLMPGAVSLSPVSARPSAASVAAPSAAYAPAAAPAGAELSAPAPSAFAAAPGSIDAHPVIALINQLQAAGVTLPDGFGTRKDADKIDAAANALPAGSPIRAQLGQIAAMIRTGGEGAGRAFDGARDVVKFEGDLTPGGTPSAPAEPNPASHELTAGQVRYSPSTESLPNGTKAVPSTEQKIVGQDDALEAIRFALEMPGDQYNLFVAGAEGSGRELAIRRILSQIAPNQPVPNDLVSATNFDEKEKPLILELPPGKGKVFEKGVEQFVKNMTESLVEEFSTGETAQQQQKIQSTLEQLSETTMAEFQKHISETKLGTKFNVFFQAMPNKQGHLQLGVAVAYQGKPLTPDTIKAEIQAGAFTQEEFDAAQEELKGKTKGIVAAFQKSMEAVGAQAVKLQGLAQQVQETAAASIVNQHANALLQAVIAGPETPELAAVKQRAEERQAEIQEAFQKAANAKYGKFAVGVTPQGGVVLVFDKQPLNSQQAVEALVAAGKFTAAEFAAAQQQLKTKFAAVQAKAQQYQAQTEREFAAVQATLPKPGPEQAKLIAYIQKLAEFAAKNYPIFVAEAMSEGKTKPGMKPVDAKDFFRVSVLADNGATHGAPVVYEENPTFERLFGAADDNDRNMMIPGVGIMKSEGPGGPTLKGGSYHKANGGYLVVNAMSVLKSPGAWEALMHAVATGKADIEEGGLIGLLSRKGDSYPVPTKVKVVLVGSPMIQMLLEQHDGDFAKSFLGVAQFQSTIKITQEAVDGFLNFLKHSVAGSEGKIIHLTKDAIARVLEQAARMAGSNQNFTAQFGAVHGLLQEATYWAKRSGQTEIRAEDVEKALSAKRDREEGYIKRMREAYEKNIFRVDTKGSAVGQLNGLAVMGSTGVVMRITFVAVPGQPGIVSIDKDAGTTGSSFNKALGVEWSFIVNEFGRENPVRAQIRISHEQNYGGIDGDSATSTTIYGILSALSGVPIQQKFAMTGSADQFGNVQAIGGVNEKIEGFFAICKSRGLTGDQGVIIPKTNVADLQLSPEVAAAIAEGRFHIYAVDHVSQGIEILTGRPYSEIKEKAQARINEISESLQKLAGGPGVGGNGGANGGVAHN
jgi:predicted ATP-dependent protease